VIRAEVPRRLDARAFETLERLLADDTQPWADDRRIVARAESVLHPEAR
jgi:hypothetical protein